MVATGPELAFDEIPGLGPDGHTQSICHVDHATHAKDAFEKLAANPGPVVIGAVQGASCFGPAYEFLFILETELRRRKLRDRVPMTFVTSEPYIGHLGLDGVGDTNGLLESEMREKHVKWIANARINRWDMPSGMPEVDVMSAATSPDVGGEAQPVQGGVTIVTIKVEDNEATDRSCDYRPSRWVARFPQFNLFLAGWSELVALPRKH